jgi:hypothetical protein
LREYGIVLGCYDDAILEEYKEDVNVKVVDRRHAGYRDSIPQLVDIWEWDNVTLPLASNGELYGDN